MTRRHLSLPVAAPRPSVGWWAGAAFVATATTAAWVAMQARRAERRHPPEGRFIDVDGVQLHYIDRGEGTPVVLLHGNALWSADFEASGLIDRLARHHRVIAFDRPGFGYSERPRDRRWTPASQARLLRVALWELGIERPAVVGHSLGALVALAMAQDPLATLGRLVLVSPYCYPEPRPDAWAMAPVAMPVLGDVLRYSVTAVTARAMLTRVVERMFGPRPVPDAFFAALPRELLVRPSQLRASAEDATAMVQAAHDASPHYAALDLPVTIVAGANDEIVDPQAHAMRLSEAIPDSKLVLLPDVGHMAHYEIPERIAVMADEVV